MCITSVFVDYHITEIVQCIAVLYYSVIYILQSVMCCSVILQYDSNIAVCITSIVPKNSISNDEKFLNFQNIAI